MYSISVCEGVFVHVKNMNINYIKQKYITKIC